MYCFLFVYFMGWIFSHLFHLPTMKCLVSFWRIPLLFTAKMGVNFITWCHVIIHRYWFNGHGVRFVHHPPQILWKRIRFWHCYMVPFQNHKFNPWPSFVPWAPDVGRIPHSKTTRPLGFGGVKCDGKKKQFTSQYWIHCCGNYDFPILTKSFHCYVTLYHLVDDGWKPTFLCRCQKNSGDPSGVFSRQKGHPCGVTIRRVLLSNGHPGLL